MPKMSITRRSHLAEEIRGTGPGLARAMGDAEVPSHVDFVAGSILAGSAAPFEEYARWAVTYSAARGVPWQAVAASFEQIEAALLPRMGGEEGKLVSEVLRAGREACRAEDTSECRAAPAGVHAHRDAFLSAISSGSPGAALQAVESALQQGAGHMEIYQAVIQDAMYEVGRRWMCGEITVAQEHMATAVARFVIARMYPLEPPPEERYGVAVVAGVQGEMHELGAYILADALRRDGWPVRYLGTDVPHRSVLDAVGRYEAALLGISATMLFNLMGVEQVVREARSRFPEAAMMVGGEAFRHAPELWRELGAGGYGPDVRSGVELAFRLRG